MKCSILGVTKTHMDKYNLPIRNAHAPQILEDLSRFSGAEAGICYMKENYFDSYVTDQEKALKRFHTVANTGHHSIAGHAQVSILFERLSKIMAMYLNNLTDYETSEKSGRYTEMHGNSSKEVELYNKWHLKIKDRIRDVYVSKIDENTVDKLAKENARNFLSVFTRSTTMGYTTSLRQWNYIIDWAERFIASDLESNSFINSLKGEFIDLVSELKPLIYVSELRDFKNRQGFNLLNFSDEDYSIVSENEVFDTVYSVNYESSFVALAQAQRHRTLHYRGYFNGTPSSFYVPDILKGTELGKEWLNDMRLIADVVPQGTMFLVNERGNLEDFYLKTMERHCGRAQIEVMQQTLNTSKKILSNIEKFNAMDRLLISQFTKSGKPKMKCQLLTCKEPCVWGTVDAQTRLI